MTVYAAQQRFYTESEICTLREMSAIADISLVQMYPLLMHGDGVCRKNVQDLGHFPHRLINPGFS